MAHSNPLNGLALYQYQSCPFCAVTRQAFNKLGLNVEIRDVLRQPKYRSDLIQHGGSPQVPCLRIEKENGEAKWLYESRDIIKYFHNLKLQIDAQQTSVSA